MQHIRFLFFLIIMQQKQIFRFKKHKAIHQNLKPSLRIKNENPMIRLKIKLLYHVSVFYWFGKGIKRSHFNLVVEANSSFLIMSIRV